MTLRGILAGWRDVATLSRYAVDGGRLTNRYSEELSFWDGLNWWWVEDNVLGPQRRLERKLETLFGSGAPSVPTDSSSGNTGIYSPQPHSYAPISSSYSHDYITGATKEVLSISSPGRPAGMWKWNNVTIQLEKKPHPIRRMLISTLLGARWIDDLSRIPSKISKRYLRLTRSTVSLSPSTSSNFTGTFTFSTAEIKN